MIRVRIEGKVGKGKAQHIEFIERDFDNDEAIEEHIKKYCKDWKKIEVKEV